MPGPYWGIIVPSEGVNLLVNPSGETGTASWGTVSAGTIGTASVDQPWGAWCGSYAPTSNTSCGVTLGSFTAGSGTQYGYSAWVKGQSGVAYVIGINSVATPTTFVGSTTFTATGSWQRVSGTMVETSTTNRSLAVTKNNNANTGVVYLDGAQVEVGTVTTYIDGEQPNCFWQGAPHASVSVRPANARNGGTLITLQSAGLIVDESPGIGMPPIDLSSQSYAQLPGGAFQRQRAAVRTMALTGYMIGTQWENLHAKRRTIINLLKPDGVAPQQSVTLAYWGEGGTYMLDAYYTNGLEFGAPDGFTETVTIGLTSTSPFWRSGTQQGTTLPARTLLGSVNYLLRRTAATGRWGTMGTNGTTINNEIAAFAIGTDGNLLLGGRFTTAGGTASGGVAFYNPNSNLFGTLSNGTVRGNVAALAVNANGTVFIGGSIDRAGGTTIKHLAYWCNAYGTLIGGTIGNALVTGLEGVNEIALTATGTTFIGGYFESIAGFASRGQVAQHANATWGTLTGGSLQLGGVDAIALGAGGAVYLGGSFVATNETGTTYSQHMVRWGNGTYYGMGSLGVAGFTNGVYAMLRQRNGRISMAGGYTGLLNGTTNGYATTSEWTGAGINPWGSGLKSGNSTGIVYGLTAHPTTGVQVMTGDFDTIALGSLPTTTGIVAWNGFTFLPMDAMIPKGINYATYDRVGNLYVGINGAGTTWVASNTTVVNTGDTVYPTLRLRNTTAGTARVWRWENPTTGDSMIFNLVMGAGEWITIQTQPGNRIITSTTRGTLSSAVLSSSAEWRLAPGTNAVSFFADNDINVSLYWTPQTWSPD